MTTIEQPSSKTTRTSPPIATYCSTCSSETRLRGHSGVQPGMTLCVYCGCLLRCMSLLSVYNCCKRRYVERKHVYMNTFGVVGGAAACLSRGVPVGVLQHFFFVFVCGHYGGKMYQLDAQNECDMRITGVDFGRSNVCQCDPERLQAEPKISRVGSW